MDSSFYRLIEALSQPNSNRPPLYNETKPTREVWDGGKEVGSAMDPPSQSRLLASVRGFVRSLVQDICNGRSPSIALDRYRTYCSDPLGNCACSFDAPFAKESISIDRQPQAAHRLGSPFSFLLFAILI